jgi:hypothetical protein
VSRRSDQKVGCLKIIWLFGLVWWAKYDKLKKVKILRQAQAHQALEDMHARYSNPT